MNEKVDIKDILYLDNNPASAKILWQDYKGKKASELYPATIDYWCMRAENVLKNNKGERYEFYSQLTGKYIDAYAVKIPALGENILAIVFQLAMEAEKNSQHLNIETQHVRRSIKWQSKKKKYLISQY